MNLNSSIIKKVKEKNCQLILLDQEAKPQIVIMSYQDYQSLCCQSGKTKPKSTSSLTSTNLLDRINNEIALWKEKQLENYPLEISFEQNIVDNYQEEDETENKIYLETIEE